MNAIDKGITYNHKNLITCTETRQAKPKPRLVFFQWNHQYLPLFLQLHMQQHVKCLAEFFEVTVISKDCDYIEICDKYQPDLALFESGYESYISKRITIKN